MDSLQNTPLAAYTDNFQRHVSTKEYETNIFSNECRYSHYGKWRRAWEYLILFLSLLAPIEISFIYIVDPEITMLEYMLSFVVDFLFVIDHRIIKHTIFITNGELVDDPKNIAKMYGTVSIWIHLISIIPLGWIGILMKNSLVYLILSLNKLLRLHRGWTAFHTTLTHLPYIGSSLTILPLFFFLFFSIHIFACILLITARFEGYENSWLRNFVGDNYNSVQMYVIGFYFTLTTVSTVGYGDIFPVTNTETIIMIFVQVIGCFMHALITSDMVSVLLNPMESDFINYYKVSQDYLKFKNIDIELRKEVRNFCQYYWETTGAAGGIRNILKNLPKSLGTTIKLELSSKFFSSTVCFSSLSSVQLAKVAKIIKHVTFSPGSYLIVQGEPCKCMLFVGKGTVQIISDGQIIATQNCTETTVHGENQMLLGSECLVSIRALTYADAWVLYKNDLSNLLRTRGYIRNIVIQSIAAAFPVMIEDIVNNMLGDMAPQMLKKIRAKETGVFKERIPQMREDQQDHVMIADLSLNPRIPKKILNKNRHIHMHSHANNETEESEGDFGDVSYEYEYEYEEEEEDMFESFSRHTSDESAELQEKEATDDNDESESVFEVEKSTKKYRRSSSEQDEYSLDDI